jgi:hypothetical protein
MYPRYKLNSKTGYIFQCENCKKSYSLTKDTWFDNSKLNFVQYFKLIYCWVNDFIVTQTVKETLINKKNVINKFQKLREVCAIVVSNNPEEIGGVVEIVEIDETKLYKRKFIKTLLHFISMFIYTVSITRAGIESMKKNGSLVGLRGDLKIVLWYLLVKEIKKPYSQ